MKTENENNQAQALLQAVQSIVGSTASKAATMNDALKAEVLKLIRDEVEKTEPRKLSIVINDVEKANVEGVTHEKFPSIVRALSANEAVYLFGPAGTGKSHTAEQAAKALNLEFYFSNCITQEYALKGFIDAGGKYQETQFYQAYTKGGLFFIDELDASIPECLIILNAAIENGYFDFPCGKVEKHKNFRIIAAGNTCGKGATSEYVGRIQQDAASMNRFIKINFDYCEEVEKAIAQGDIELVHFARAYRKACKRAGIQSLFTYRNIRQIKALQNAGENLSDAINYILLADLTKDDKEAIDQKILPLANDFQNYYTAFSLALCA